MASQAVSAIADALGAAISLSVPELVLERGGRARSGRCAPSAGGARELAFISELSAPGAELRVLLVIAPDA